MNKIIVLVFIFAIQLQAMDPTPEANEVTRLLSSSNNEQTFSSSPQKKIKLTKMSHDMLTKKVRETKHIHTLDKIIEIINKKINNCEENMDDILVAILKSSMDAKAKHMAINYHTNAFTNNVAILQKIRKEAQDKLDELN